MSDLDARRAFRRTAQQACHLLFQTVVERGRRLSLGACEATFGGGGAARGGRWCALPPRKQLRPHSAPASAHRRPCAVAASRSRTAAGSSSRATTRATTTATTTATRPPAGIIHADLASGHSPRRCPQTRRTHLHLSYSYAAPCGPALLVRGANTCALKVGFAAGTFRGALPFREG
jgi:hypothetical protein